MLEVSTTNVLIGSGMVLFGSVLTLLIGAVINRIAAKRANAAKTADSQQAADIAAKKALEDADIVARQVREIADAAAKKLREEAEMQYVTNASTQNTKFIEDIRKDNSTLRDQIQNAQGRIDASFIQQIETQRLATAQALQMQDLQTQLRDEQKASAKQHADDQAALVVQHNLGAALAAEERQAAADKIAALSNDVLILHKDVDTANTHYANLQGKYLALSDTTDKALQTVAKLQAQVDALSEQIRGLGGTPVISPAV